MHLSNLKGWTKRLLGWHDEHGAGKEEEGQSLGGMQAGVKRRREEEEMDLGMMPLAEGVEGASISLGSRVYVRLQRKGTADSFFCPGVVRAWDKGGEEGGEEGGRYTVEFNHATVRGLFADDVWSVPPIGSTVRVVEKRNSKKEGDNGFPLPPSSSSLPPALPTTAAVAAPAAPPSLPPLPPPLRPAAVAVAGTPTPPLPQKKRKNEPSPLSLFSLPPALPTTPVVPAAAPPSRPPPPPPPPRPAASGTAGPPIPPPPRKKKPTAASPPASSSSLLPSPAIPTTAAVAAAASPRPPTVAVAGAPIRPPPRKQKSTPSRPSPLASLPPVSAPLASLPPSLPLSYDLQHLSPTIASLKGQGGGIQPAGLGRGGRGEIDWPSTFTRLPRDQWDREFTLPPPDDPLYDLSLRVMKLLNSQPNLEMCDRDRKIARLQEKAVREEFEREEERRDLALRRLEKKRLVGEKYGESAENPIMLDSSHQLGNKRYYCPFHPHKTYKGKGALVVHLKKNHPSFFVLNTKTKS